MTHRRIALAGANVLVCLLAAGCSGSAFSSATGDNTSPLDGGSGSSAGGGSSTGGSRTDGSAGGSGGTGSGGSTTTGSGGSASGGADGSVISGGEAGVVSPPDSGFAGAGGAGGSGGTGGSGGAGGTTVVCLDPSTWYRDKDLDGYGTDIVSKVSCEAPAPTGWSQVGGDCQDDNPAVHPGQTTYFGQPFGTSGPDSFDYDCSGTEEGDPALPIATSTCVVSPLSACTGSGYLPVSGTGRMANPLCGSQNGAQCSGASIACARTLVSNLKPYTCR